MKEIFINGRSIYYKVIKKNIKNINFRIKKDLVLYISIPKWFSNSDIEDLIFTNKKFITDSIENLENYNNNMKTFKLNHGDEIIVFNKKLLIKIIYGELKRIQVENNNLVFYIKKDNFQLKKELLFEYITKYCNDYFNKINISTHKLFSKYNLPLGNINYRKMKNTLGNCRPSKNLITINKKLALMEKLCCEYVFIHEYTHFIHLDHSKEFYSLLEKMMPSYKETEKILNNYIHLFNFNDL